MSRRSVFLVLFLALSLAACAARRDLVPAGAEDGPRVGLYRARLEETGGRSEKFRMLLFAAPPDRIHGEVLSPVGGTVFVFDGGAGRIAITLVRDGVAFVGDAGPEVLEKLIGVPVRLEDLVQSLLFDEGGGGAHAVAREPRGSSGLPERYAISAGGRSLQLQLKRLQVLKRPGAGLGTGEPPPGLELLPLERLEPLREWDQVEAGETGVEP